MAPKQVPVHSFHDGNLTGVQYANGNAIFLDFSTGKGQHFRISLTGVIRFVATDLLEGNIVFDVLSTSFGNLEAALADEYITGALFGTVPHTGKELDNWRQQIRNHSLNVFVVEPSYGASVIALCQGVALLSDDSDSRDSIDQES